MTSWRACGKLQAVEKKAEELERKRREAQREREELDRELQRLQSVKQIRDAVFPDKPATMMQQVTLRASCCPQKLKLGLRPHHMTGVSTVFHSHRHAVARVQSTPCVYVDLWL